MNNNDTDIDGMLKWMTRQFGGDDKWVVAVRTLVAERNALRERVAVGEMQLRDARRDAYWPADRDRDLRERLVCAALTGILANYESRNHGADDVAEWTVLQADATLAAMRKGATDAK